MFWKSFSKKRRFGRVALVLGLVLAGIGASALALASDDPETPKPWPERILRSIRTAADHGFVELSSAVFNNFDKLFDVSPVNYPGNGKAGIAVHRDVLDNFDLMNTYTVIDHVKIKTDARPFASLTTWTEDRETPALGTPYIGLVFAPQASIEWTNVRQVKALDFRKEPSTKDLRERARLGLADAPVAQASPIPSPSPDPDLSELNPDVPIAFLDPSIRARFSKIGNLVSFPFRVPLHRADVSRMKDGEILGYAFDGQIEVGVSAGLRVIPTLNVLHAGIDVRGTVLLHGRYQISVLRESERFARVKLTHLREHGRKASIRIGVDRKGAFDGVMLFKGSSIEMDHVGKWDANLVPFDFETSHIRSDQFDVVYRYDLDSNEGKKAYHKAVLGRFVESETAATEASREGQKERAVERLLSREGVRTTGEEKVKVELGGILNLDWNSKREALDATLVLPDGSHHLLEALHEKRKERKVLFGGTSEKFTKRMTLYLDAELLAKNDPESVFVITEITDEDSNTKAKELNAAIDRMETLLRRPDILPAVAAKVPGRKDPTNTRKAWYGRSSFYYGYSLSLEEVGAFLRTDRARIAEAAGRNFNQDEAARLVAAWEKASAALEARAPAPELFAALKGVFAAKFAVVPLTNVIFDALPAKLIDYFVTAQNVAFGRIRVRGKTITSVEKALTNTDRELGFETYAKRLKQDAEAVVSEFSVDEVSGGLKRIRFTLGQKPAQVFFRLFRVSGFKRQKLVAEVVAANANGRFHAGVNELVLDPNSVDLLTAKLSRDLRRGEFYSLSIAYARTNDRYGEVASSRFEVEEPYPAKAASEKAAAAK